VIPLIDAINSAKKSLDIAIFRFDRNEIETALENAARRGLCVRALIAYTNRGGERSLRNLEMRLLAGGVMVARTANDLARYHDKFMIVDRHELYMLAFNFTYLDIEHSRSFGVAVRDRRLVQEAVKLFEADTMRQPYLNGMATFVVSPVNARRRLSAFLRGARKELLIYDPEVSDAAMTRLLEERAAAGVDVKIIGKLKRRSPRLAVRKLVRLRLHTRTIVRDGESAFIGSQSLRAVELEKRRELGIIVRDRKVVSQLHAIFTADWNLGEEYGLEEGGTQTAPPVTRLAKKVAKTVARDLPPVAPVVEVIVKEVGPEIEVDTRQVEEAVKQAVKEAVREAVQDVVEKVANPQER